VIRVHIERLTLDGVPLGPGGAERVRAAMEERLAAAMAGAALAPDLTGGGARPVLAAPDVALDVAGPAHVGRRLAAGVARALTAAPRAGARR
jgi:hypothetical protein